MSFSASFFILFPPFFYSVSPSSLYLAHTPIFSCWNCQHSLYERVKWNQNHAEVIMKLVFKAVCLVSEARPAHGMWILARCSGTGARPWLLSACPVPAAQAVGRGEGTVLEQRLGMSLGSLERGET